MTHQKISVFIFLLIAQVTFGQVRECPTLDLTPGAETVSALDTADCRISDFLGGTNASFAKRYRLKVAAAAVLTITLESGDFDTLLYVLNADPVRTLASNNDAAGQGTNSRAVIHLPAGDYYVLAAAARALLTGAFRLNAASEAPRSCPTVDMPADGSTEGAFAAASCRLADLAPLASGEAFIAMYRLRMARRSVLAVDAATAIPRFSMVLLTPEGDSFGGLTKMLVSLDPGVMVVGVSAAAEGSFTLTAKTEDLRPCTLLDAQPAGEWSGDLTADSCRWLDLFPPNDDATAMQLYRMRVDSASVIQVDQTSTVFDTYLTLWTTAYRRLAFNDDLDRASTDSRVLIHLTPGTYLIGASGFDETDRGPFQLKTTAEAPRTCPVPDLLTEAPNEGTLAAEGCRVLDLVPLGTDPNIVTPFRLSFDAQRMVSLNLSLQPASGALSVLAPTGAVATSTTVDRNGSAAIEFLAPAGNHTVYLTSTSAVRPTFTLRAGLREPPACAVEDLDATATVDSSLTDEQCRFREVIPYTTSASRLRQYRVRVPSRGTLQLSMTSSAFPPLLYVMAGPTLIGANFRFTPGQLTLGGTLPAGEYTILAGAVGTTGGAFQLKTQFTADGVTSSIGEKTPEVGSGWEMAIPGEERVDRGRRRQKDANQ